MSWHFNADEAVRLLRRELLSAPTRTALADQHPLLPPAFDIHVVEDILASARQEWREGPDSEWKMVEDLFRQALGAPVSSATVAQAYVALQKRLDTDPQQGAPPRA